MPFVQPQPQAKPIFRRTQLIRVNYLSLRARNKERQIQNGFTEAILGFNASAQILAGTKRDRLGFELDHLARNGGH